MSKMLAAGVEANTISYNTVIKACAEAKGVVTAGQWMSKMLFAGLGGRTVDVQDAGCKDLLSADTCYIYMITCVVTPKAIKLMNCAGIYSS